MRESREQQTAMYDQPEPVVRRHSFSGESVKDAVARLEKSAPWVHDTCPSCGWDGDAAIVRDPDQGLMGFECPDCFTFVVTRDLENDN
jgi:predicted RNA-binding Zn-ribbon protein involved in translation (DUF1610 family)